MSTESSPLSEQSFFFLSTPWAEEVNIYKITQCYFSSKWLIAATSELWDAKLAEKLWHVHACMYLKIQLEIYFRTYLWLQSWCCFAQKTGIQDLQRYLPAWVILRFWVCMTSMEWSIWQNNIKISSNFSFKFSNSSSVHKFWVTIPV